MFQLVVKKAQNLELDHLSLAFLVTTQFEMFASLQWCLLAVFALSAFHTKYNLFGCLGLCAKNNPIISPLNFFMHNLWIFCTQKNAYLLPEDGLGLTTKTLLFAIVTTTSLGCSTFLRLFVLCHFV